MKANSSESIYDSAVTTLQKALKSFGPKGKFWTKGVYGTTSKRSLDAQTFLGTELRMLGEREGGPDHPLYMCSMGAIMYADGPGEAMAQNLLADSIKELFPNNDNSIHMHGISRITGFNDQKHRRFSDIQKVFKHAMKLAKKNKKSEAKGE